jgi:hypothetical protein
MNRVMGELRSGGTSRVLRQALRSLLATTPRASPLAAYQATPRLDLPRRRGIERETREPEMELEATVERRRELEPEPKKNAD